MTQQEIYDSIDQGLQNLSSFTYQNFEPAEVDLQFNTIVDLFVENALGKSKLKELSVFEGVQVTMDDLRLLKIIDHSIPLTNGRGPLPENYRHLINDRTMRTYCGSSRLVPNRLYENEFVYDAIEHPFEQPKINSPISYLENNFIVIKVAAGTTASSVVIDYIRVPKLLDFNEPDWTLDWSETEFPRNTMRKIIDITVRRLLETTQSTRFQTKAIEIKQ